MKSSQFYVGRHVQPKPSPKLLFMVIILFKLNSITDGKDIYSTCNSQDYTLKIYGEAVSNPFGECSGNGVCIRNDTACDCETGWTGLSDFVNTENIDCQINILAIKVTWGLIIAYILVSQYIKVIPVFFLRWHAFNNTRMPNGKRYPILQVPIFLACCIMEFILFPSIVIFGLIRISNDDERVGVTFAPTLFLAIMGTSLWVGQYLFTPTIIETCIDGTSLDKQDIITQLRLNRFSAIVHNILSVLKWFIPFLVYAGNGTLNESTTFLWKLYVILHSLTMYFAAAQAIYAKVVISRVFMNSYRMSENKRMKDAESKLSGIQTNQMFQGFFFGSCYLAQLLIPFLWNKYDYFIPITAFGFSIGATQAILTTASKSKAASTDEKTMTVSMKLSTPEI